MKVSLFTPFFSGYDIFQKNAFFVSDDTGTQAFSPSQALLMDVRTPE